MRESIMFRKFILTFLVGLLVLSACSPAATPQPTWTPAPLTPEGTTPNTATATIQPVVELKQVAALYSGPDNADFDLVASLKAGAAIIPLGSYKDFIQAKVMADGQEFNGFIWKGALETLPAGLPELTSDQVPWQPLYLPQCSPGLYTASQDSVAYTNPASGYSDNESSAIALTKPLHLALTSAVSQGTEPAAIKILGIPEPVTGDWWQGITRLDFGYANGSYFIGIRDGTKSNYSILLNLPYKTGHPIQLVFDQPEGKSFRVLDEHGQLIKAVDLSTSPDLHLPGGLFPSGIVYIGTTLPPKTNFTLTGLRIGTLASGKWVEAQNGYYTQPGLATLAAAHHVSIGTEFSVGSTSDPHYCRVMQRDFNLSVLSEFSSPDLWLAPGQYDFSLLDQAVEYAFRHGWRIRASHLLWGNPDVLPGWLKNSNYTRAEYIQLLEQYIQDIVSRYRGRVQEWSIANEATNRSFSPGADFWNDKIGPDYIALAFRAARAADPNGILIFNEDNNQAPQDEGTTRVIDKMFSTVSDLKAAGVPIDAVGMQMHLFLPWNSPIRPQKAAVIATMLRFAALGVRIDISELDMDLARQPGTQADKWTYEAGIYRDMMEACLESDVCDSFTTWDISDATSWITCDFQWCVNDKNADPLMFDLNYDPKPAYFAVRDALLTDFTVATPAASTK
jgi:endo-1,4-beta-xylanase